MECVLVFRRFKVSACPASQKLAFQPPCMTVSFQDFTGPSERIRRNLSEHPADRCSVGTGANLDDVFAAPAANQFIPAAGNRVDPRDAPCLNRRIPYAQRSAIHVAGLFELRRTVLAAWHDPDILDSAALQHPSEMYFALDVARENVNAVAANIQLPAADQPAVNVVSRCDLRRTA